MSFLSRVFGKSEQKADFLGGIEWFTRLFDVSRAKTGQSVTLSTALRVVTVLACSRVMSEDVAALPFRVVREGKGGFDVPATDHPLYRLMDLGPNEWQTGYEFRETMMMHTMLTGNFYAFINKVRGDKIVEILPFTPGQVTVKKQGTELIYKVIASGDEQIFPSSQIWHVRGPSTDTYLGLDIVQQAREAIGLAMATEETHSRLHQNGVKTTGAYSVEGKMDDNQFKRLSAWLEKYYQGIENNGKPLILDNGAKWVSNTMAGVDAEHLATREYQLTEICRAMRVLPIMIGHSDKTSTYASAEQMFIAHNAIVGKWCRRIDNSGDKRLLSPKEYDSGYRMRHEINQLNYADTAAKAEWYSKMFNIAGMSPNQIRAQENMAPYPEGDKFYVPVNLRGVDDPLPKPTPPNKDLAK